MFISSHVTVTMTMPAIASLPFIYHRDICGEDISGVVNNAICDVHFAEISKIMCSFKSVGCIPHCLGEEEKTNTLTNTVKNYSYMTNTCN